MSKLKGLIGRFMSASARARLRSLHRRLTGVPAIGEVNFGDLRRVKPVSSAFGLDRGLPVDRIYVEDFLKTHANDIQGAVLEVADSIYTARFGAERVSCAEILDVDPSNRKATIIADLTDAPHLASDRFDAIILTQTLQLIFDISAVVDTLHRILKPGGILLLTVPGISSVCRRAGTAHTWCWSFTEASLRPLLGNRFGDDQVTTRTYGNVLTATAFLHGLAANELEPLEYNSFDPDYPVIVAARATKAHNTA